MIRLVEKCSTSALSQPDFRVQQISRNALASGSRADRHSEPDASAFRLIVLTRILGCDAALAWILHVDIQAHAHPFEELFGIAVEILFAAATSER